MNKFLKNIKILAFSIVLCGEGTMSFLAYAAPAVKIVEEGFSVSGAGGHRYGSNGIGVWLSGRINIGLSDTIEMETNGVGVIENQLSPDDLKLVKDIHRELCTIGDEKPATELTRIDPPLTYSVTCMQDGSKKTLVGRLDSLPKKIAFLMNDFNLKAQKDYVSVWRSIAKLDVAIESMVQQKDEFIVSVKFINSGDYPMITGSPDNWSGIWGENLLWINGESSDGKNKLNVDLSGLPLLNKSDFPDEFVTIPSRSTVTYKFAVKPTDKIKAGTYSLETRVFMSVGANDGPVATMGKVDFHSDRSKPTHIIIDRDYPSTPEEWKDFDARKAKEVSSLLPGTTVTVPGYYRAISVFGPRAQFVTELKAGKPAPPLDINHWDKWEWETDLARTTICEAGDICPRDGRWVVRTVGQRLGDERVTHSQHERRLRTGDVMPTLAAETGIGRHYRWEWLGLS